MPALLLDSTGKPIPQYKNATGTAFEALRGANGGIDVNIISGGGGGESSPVVASIYKHVAELSHTATNDIWTPEAGKSIVLMGMKAQNYRTIAYTESGGITFGDTSTLAVLEEATMITQMILPARHIISNTTDDIYMVTPYSEKSFNFGSGLVLSVDAVLKVTVGHASIMFSAWGYEV